MSPQDERTADGAPDPRLATAAFVVVNWNLPQLTVRCVKDLLSDGVPAERIVIVDSGSSDGSVEQLRREFPHSVHVAIRENVGYGRASNEGAGAIEASTYVFINNDAFVHEAGSCARLVEAVHAHDVALAVPRLLNGDYSLQRSVVPLTSPLNALIRATGFSRAIPNRWQPRWSTYWDHDESRDIECAAGAVIAVRGEFWKDVGGFGSRTPMYAEELHLFWRAREEGWRARFVEASMFLHLENASAGTRWTEAERAEAKAVAETLALRELMPPSEAFATILFTALGLVGRLVVFTATRRRRRAAEARGYLRGQLRGLRVPVSLLGAFA